MVSLRTLAVATLLTGAGMPKGLCREVHLGAHTFTLPDGFEIECVAAPPLVQRPIAASFDEDGRLYVTDSSGSNAKLEAQLLDKPHRVLRLEDTTGSGFFNKSDVFADSMMFPEGILWMDGSVYVGAPPSIWKLTDTRDSGAADRREEWYKGGTLTGCGNDIHGPYAGLDGWIYWCKGGFAEQVHDRPGLPPTKDRAAHIYRCRPDGSGIESVIAGGMDNPVAVAFTPEDEPIFAATFLDLAGDGTRDGLGHGIYGGVFPKINRVTDDLPQTGELLPPMTQLGPAAPSGICRCTSAGFGADWQGNFLVPLFNLHRVMRHVLVPDGATFRTENSVFLSSDNPDFHPTCVVEDADGSLLVIDTGGWYKLCCPTSQLSKPDVLGAIYRIRRKSAQPPEDARGFKIAWIGLGPAQLAELLSDPRPAVVEHSIRLLGKMGKEAVPALRNVLATSASVDACRSAIWALARIDAPQAREAVREALHARDSTVQRTAIKAAGLWRDPSASEAVGSSLRSGILMSDLQTERTAAEALGRIGRKESVPLLLKAAGANRNDRFLEHALVYALIELGDANATAAGLDPSRIQAEPTVSSLLPGYPAASLTDSLAISLIETFEANSAAFGIAAPPPALFPASERRAALIALDQMAGHPLQAGQVTPLLSSNEPRLAQTARWIVAHHPGWSGALRDYLTRQLARPDLSEEEAAGLQTLLANSTDDPESRVVIATAAVSGSRNAKLAALRVMARADVKRPPPAWSVAIATALQSGEPDITRAGLAAAHTLASGKEPSPDAVHALLHFSREFGRSPELRVEALDALPASLLPADADLIALLKVQLEHGKNAILRGKAAAILARMPLADDARFSLARSLSELGASEAMKLLPVFENPSLQLAKVVIVSLRGAVAISAFQPQALKALFATFPQSLQVECDLLLAQIDSDAIHEKERLDKIASELPPGDVRRGQAVFNSSKASCVLCHTIGYLGGKLGPDLTAIGSVRTERDLLESVVFPSASFVRSYEPYVVRLKNGDEYTGIVRSEDADAIVIAIGLGAEVHLDRADVVLISPGTVSLMPQGFDRILSRQELADLIAFLKSTKWGP